MVPIQFKGANIIVAKDQPPYIPLPAHFSGDSLGTLVTCWELTEADLERIKTTRCIWLTQVTFNQLVQPQCASIEPPYMEEVGEKLPPEDLLPVRCGHGIPMGIPCDECAPALPNEATKTIRRYSPGEGNSQPVPVEQPFWTCPKCGFNNASFFKGCSRCHYLPALPNEKAQPLQPPPEGNWTCPACHKVHLRSFDGLTVNRCCGHYRPGYVPEMGGQFGGIGFATE